MSGKLNILPARIRAVCHRNITAARCFKHFVALQDKRQHLEATDARLSAASQELSGTQAQMQATTAAVDRRAAEAEAASAAAAKQAQEAAARLAAVAEREVVVQRAQEDIAEARAQLAAKTAEVRSFSRKSCVHMSDTNSSDVQAGGAGYDRLLCLW